jgi:hypothetical protein
MSLANNIASIAERCFSSTQRYKRETNYSHPAKREVIVQRYLESQKFCECGDGFEIFAASHRNLDLLDFAASPRLKS